MIARSYLDGGNTGIVRKRVCVGEPRCPTGTPDEAHTEHRAYSVDVQQTGFVLVECLGHARSDISQGSIEATYVTYQVPCQALAGAFDWRDWADRTQETSRLLGCQRGPAPPGMRSRSRAWRWFTARTRCAATFARRSSSRANTVVSSSGVTNTASPWRAATHAAAAASITSFLRR